MRIRTLMMLGVAASAFLAGPIWAQEDEASDEQMSEEQTSDEQAALEYIEKSRENGDFPKAKRAMNLIQREAEIGGFGPIDDVIGIPTTPRYLVTYMNSQTGSRVRSATAVSVTNQTNTTCRVTVSYFKGLTNDSSPVCSSQFSIPSRFTIDYCSRNLPTSVTTCNSTCNPELTFDEGRAIVASTCRDIGVSARVYYTSGDGDEAVEAITDSKIVRYGQRNNGD